MPREGHIPPLPGTDAVPNNLNVVGPLARSAEDLELLLDVLTDGRGETGPVELLPPRRQRLEDYRVAVWLTDPRVAVDDEVLDVLEPMVERLREAGARIDVEGRPDFSLAENHETYFALLIADVAGLPPEAGLLAHQDEQRRKWEAFFRDYDVLLCPVTPTVAFPHDQSEPMFTRTILVNGEPQPYMDFLVWAGLATLSGLPATAAPVGLSASGLPVGVQIVGAFMEDRTTLDFARRLASVVGGFRAPPGY